MGESRRVMVVVDEQVGAAAGRISCSYIVCVCLVLVAFVFLLLCEVVTLAF